MSYSPVNSDATNVAGYTITRLNATSPSSGAVTSDQAVAIADSYLGAIGYQGQSSANALGAASTNSTTFADIGNGSSTGFASYSFSAPVAKTYLVDVRFKMFASALTAGADSVFFQLLVGATPYWPSDGRWHAYATNQQIVQSMIVPVTMSAGSNVIKLQWKVNTATTTVANVDAGSYRTFTVIG